MSVAVPVVSGCVILSTCHPSSAAHNCSFGVKKKKKMIKTSFCIKKRANHDQQSSLFCLKLYHSQLQKDGCVDYCHSVDSLIPRSHLPLFSLNLLYFQFKLTFRQGRHPYEETRNKLRYSQSAHRCTPVACLKMNKQPTPFSVLLAPLI